MRTLQSIWPETWPAEFEPVSADRLGSLSPNKSLVGFFSSTVESRLNPETSRVAPETNSLRTPLLLN